MSSPQTIGKYEIIQEIGRGGFAVVYQARDTHLDRLVALKVLYPHWSHDPGLASRFQREAQTVARLRHPHIVTIYEAGEADGQYYLAMAYLPGRTLHDLLAAEGALPLVRALPILKQIASALDYAHAQGMVHRDVKPANIIVEETEESVQATLTDFGLVKALAEGTALTSLGTLLGSPEYMAPEQADPNRAAEVGPAADRYALGIVAYELLTGRVPFPGNTPATLNAHEHKPPPPPRELRPDLPKTVEAALLKILAKAPADRYPSASAFVAALQSSLIAPVSPHREHHRSTRPTLPTGTWKVGAVIGVVALIFLLGWRVWGWVGPLSSIRGPTTPTQIPTLAATSEPAARVENSLEPTLTATWPPTATNTPEPTATPTLPPTHTPLPPPPTPTDTPLPPTDTATPLLSVSELEATRVREADGMTMVYVPAGIFLMGSADDDPAAQDEEKPQHQVTLDAFWIDRTEVTNAQFRKFVQDTSYTTTAEEAGGGHVTGKNFEAVPGANWQHPSGPDSLAEDHHPAVQVSWYDASAYCAWAEGRLPTEAEWEYAARGPENFIYPWGDQFDGTNLNFCDKNCSTDNSVDDGYAQTAPVGNYPAGASWVGGLDLAGNVYEWTNDWAALYSNSPSENPTGPETGGYKAIRGGSWGNGAENVRAAFRSYPSPNYMSDILGFRCVVSPGR